MSQPSKIKTSFGLHGRMRQQPDDIIFHSAGLTECLTEQLADSVNVALGVTVVALSVSTMIDCQARDSSCQKNSIEAC